MGRVIAVTETFIRRNREKLYSENVNRHEGRQTVEFTQRVVRLCFALLVTVELLIILAHNGSAINLEFSIKARKNLLTNARQNKAFHSENYYPVESKLCVLLISFIKTG